MKDSIVESVLSKYKQRSEVGINKYGVTLDRTDLTELEWLIHAQEEAMDLSLYLEKLIKLKQNDTRIKRCKAKCECGGSERIALDCTMKPCKHPKYN